MLSTETTHCKRRALLILSKGYVIIPCSYCKSKSAKYIIKEGHKNYSEYTYHRCTCNNKGVSITKGL